MTTMSSSRSATETSHVDVLIVGAGISGIGAAYHLKTRLPHKTFAILEGREAIGGTWDLFRYPGIRSDSDLHTFGYEFKPWTSDNAIAGADEILAYLRETVAENDLGPHIRFGHKVLGANWSSRDARWTVRVQNAGSDESFEMTCGVLFSAAGYYDYSAGHTPHFEGRDDFAGDIVHPQHWPEDLDYAGKRVVVIGSGATAVTLIPAMARDAAHVTMLQRSPSYVMTLPAKDPIANGLRRALPEKVAYRITRRLNIARQRLVYDLSRRHPQLVRRLIRWMTKRQLPAGYRRRHALQAALQPLGPAALRRAGRRPVQGDQRRPRVGRHRPHRPLHRARHPARVRRRAPRRRDRHRDRPAAAGFRRHRLVGRRRARSTFRRGSPTRA